MMASKRGEEEEEEERGRGKGRSKGGRRVRG
jgi:hypothetical protein